jgi:alpha-D-xyloside xylohydrolase
MPLKMNIAGSVWEYVKNRIKYPFTFKKRINEYAEPNISYGLTDHPLDIHGTPLGSLFGVAKKLLGKKSYSIRMLKFHSRDNNRFLFECIGQNIFLQRRIPDDEYTRNQYPSFSTNAKPSKLLLQIHILGADTYRVTCTMKDKIPEHKTQMMQGDIINSSISIDFVISEEFYQIKTSKLMINLYRDDFRIDIFNFEGKLITESSGYSSNDFPYATDSLPLGFVKIKRGKRLFGTESFTLYPGEAIYGLGEQFSSLNKIGQTISLWNWEGYGNSTGRTYKNVPFFLSTRGYGVFFNESKPITYWVGSREYNRNFIAVEGDLIDYYFFYGPDLKHVLHNYTELTGKANIPPKWSFGAWMSRISYKQQDEVLSTAQRLREEEYPFDVICIDTNWFKIDWCCDWKFDETKFPDPKEMCNKLHEMGFRLSLWQMPYIMKLLPEYKEAKKLGIIAKNRGPFIFLTNPSSVIDFSNPKAVKWYQGKLRNLFEIGADVIKVDFGEQIESHMKFQDGDGRKMHNLFSLLYQKAAFEVTKAFFGKGIIWARSGYAGSQRYPLHWSGDSSSHFEELPNVLRSGLSLGMCGFTFWSQDVGGFIFSPSDKLYIRWTEFSIFNSHIRFHGNPPRFREPWNYNKETQKITRDMLNLRYKLIPYIYTESQICASKGLPMMKSLVLDYIDDPNVYNIEDEYMFGRNLLIAPIITREDTRKIYFPEGEWIDYWSFETYEGGKWSEYECPIERIPFFIKGGSILPLGPLVQHTKQMKMTDPLTLLVVPTAKNEISNYQIIDDDWSCVITVEIFSSELKISTTQKNINIQRVEIPINYKIDSITVNGLKLNVEIKNNRIIGKYESD